MRKIVFLTGTRADFGKLKSLIQIVSDSDNFEVHLFVTGMHLNSKYGKTIDEIYKCGFPNIYPFINHEYTDFMDRNLAKTIDGFSHYISELSPDLIVVHGDRVEALAGAIVGSMNNILVAHIEGGEVSGTIDELIRHSTSKMCHIHLASNEEASTRLVQMGELPSSVFNIGSPDLDIMLSENLPPVQEALNHYEIEFEKYSILLFHPVTTEQNEWKKHTSNVVDAVVEANKKFIVIYPNNDLGSEVILDAYNKKFAKNINFKIFPSLRFEYFLSLLKNAESIVGNSSVGIREAPYFGVPTIDIGSRQKNRFRGPTIKHCDYNKNEILGAIVESHLKKFEPSSPFGDGKSDQKFLELLSSDSIWQTPHQKQFREVVYND